MLHNEGLTTKNYTSYNFQVLRDDAYFLGVDGTVTGHRIAPARSSCAVLVSSQNANREWLYYTQQTISAEGFSGQAFSTFVPHTVRAKETKQCSDCHVSAANDNNAWMAQLLLQGTNFMNFMGRYVYVATGNKGFEAIAVAEHDEPEAIYGSDLQRVAYPDDFKKFVAHDRQLASRVRATKERSSTSRRAASTPTRQQGRAACASTTSRISTTKASLNRSPPRQSLPSASVFTCQRKMRSPSLRPQRSAVDPLRTRIPENEEQPIHLLYGFLYVADKEEGLVIVGNPDLKAKSPGVGTLLDGNPANNFLNARPGFQSRRHTHRCAPHHYRRYVCLHPHGQSSRRRGSRQSSRSENHRHDRLAVPQ